MSEISKEKLNDIKIQMEYYLSDENLKKDQFFHQKIYGLYFFVIFPY